MTAPLHDLSDCVLDCAVPITIRRAVAAPLEHGRKQEPVWEEIATRATVVPVTGDKRQMTTDGHYSEGAITLYAAEPLRSIHESDVGVADRVCYGGVEYCVQVVKSWYELGGFYEVIAERAER